MNLLIAPNSMKGSLNAQEFADVAAAAIRSVSPEFQVRCIPVADGGDFTGEILINALQAEKISVCVSDPLGRPITVTMGVHDRTAIIEMASASGLRLLAEPEMNPWKTSTFGTGQLIRHAADMGCNTILLGLGGSATVDGGIGMLGALGFTFVDDKGNILPALASSLSLISEVILPDVMIHDVEIILLNDVNNPLLGEDGSAHSFGPQKGADPEMVLHLEKGLENWIKVIEKMSGRNIRNLPGAGAAGGIACGLIGFLNARLIPGAEYIMDMLQMEKHLEWADLVITGEGRIDKQSVMNKAPYALARRAIAAGKPIIAWVGSFDPDAADTFDGVFSIINGPVSLNDAMEHARELVAESATQLAKLLYGLKAWNKS